MLRPAIAFSIAAALALVSAAPASFAEENLPPKEPFADLESVKAFDELIAALGEMRTMILEDAVTEREASEGMRFLLRTVAMSQDVTGDGFPLAPHFARMDSKRRKIGGDNPNAEYDNVVWDGSIDYKITGNRGSVDHLSFQALVRLPSGRSSSIGYVNERDL